MRLLTFRALKKNRRVLTILIDSGSSEWRACASSGRYDLLCVVKKYFKWFRLRCMYDTLMYPRVYQNVEDDFELFRTRDVVR